MFKGVPDLLPFAVSRALAGWAAAASAAPALP
jgi:hypothetical protein